MELKSYYQDNHIKIYNKDCRDMSELPDGSIQCVITSPPFWGLRKYSGEQDFIWGGDPHCGHNKTIPSPLPSVPKAGNKQRDYIENGRYIGKHRWQHDTQLHPTRGNRGQGIDPKHNPAGVKQPTLVSSSFCSLCGAWKGAYGLEPTPEMYIQHTIEILREIKRVLRKDGVVFWDIGDSYAGVGGYSQKPKDKDHSYWSDAIFFDRPKGRGVSGSIKPKDLCLIPFRVAIAAQEDGWWVRSVIIWSKSNPMPESVTDRPTESHEYILMLTKSAKYYWDAEAVREAYIKPMNRWGGEILKADGESMWDKGTGQSTYRDRNMRPNPTGRNIRTVWEFPTQPYPEAHFAVFPEKLPEICIKAATPEAGCCSQCGAPWARITDHFYNVRAVRARTEKQFESVGGSRANMPFMGDKISETLGWQPTCKCNADKVPSLILDPFLGAGTTCWVAKRLRRKAVGYELSEEYCALAVERNRQQTLL